MPPNVDAVRARREHVHQLARCRRSADTGSTPPPNALPRITRVRSYALMLVGEPGAGAPKTRLHFVDNQEHVVRVAQRPQAGEPACRRNDDAGLALDRLDQHGAPCPAVIARSIAAMSPNGTSAEARRERPEAVAVRRGSDEKPTMVVVRPWKLPCADDDLRAVARHALDVDRPSWRAALIAVSTASAPVFIGQRGIEPGELAQRLEERPDAIVVKGARRHGEPLRLRVQRREDARMAVAVAGGRIGAHHVDVAPPVDVPQVRRLRRARARRGADRSCGRRSGGRVRCGSRRGSWPILPWRRVTLQVQFRHA